MTANDPAAVARPPVERLAAGLHVVRMPLPLRVAPVNCYVGERPDGSLLVVDTGIAIGAAESWTAALAELGHTPTDVSGIFITHFHPDHIGAAQPLSDLTGAPVLATRLTVEQCPRTWGPGAEESFALIDEHLLRHGLPRERLQAFAHESEVVRLAVRVPTDMQVLEAGDVLTFAGADWELVPTPGHADGHACLLDRAGSRIIAGDHLLERISPAIGLYPEHGAHPLADYRASLELVAGLDPHLVLPGHGDPFEGAARRCGELARHHEERADDCTAALATGPLSAWQVARTVFGDHLDADGERFATTEALAHLDWLECGGRVTSLADDDGIVRWQQVDASSHA